MDWVPITSSVFTSAAHAPERQILYLRFRSGEVYKYFDFTAEDFRRFLAAESQGRYFAAHIREQFRSEHYLHIHNAGAGG